MALSESTSTVGIISSRLRPRPQTSAAEDIFDYRERAALLMRTAAADPVPTSPASGMALPAAVATPPMLRPAATPLHRPMAESANGSDSDGDSSSIEELKILAPTAAGKKRCHKQPSLPQVSPDMERPAVPVALAAKKRKTPQDAAATSKKRATQNASGRGKTATSAKKDPSPSAGPNEGEAGKRGSTLR